MKKDNKTMSLPYMKDMYGNAHTIMSKKKQVELIRKYKETGDLKYQDILIKSNLRYIYSVAKKFKKGNIEMDELMSSGCCGMMVAIEKYDETNGASFLTYAKWWMEQQMRKDMIERWSVIKIPDGAWYLMRKIKKLKDNGNSIYSIAEECNVSINMVKLLLEYKLECSLDKQIDDSENGAVYFDLMGSDSIEYTADLKKHLLELIESLDEQKANIIKMRYGIGFDRAYTLDEVAKMYGRTRERIRQIQCNALTRLRKKINKDNRI